MAEMIGGLAGSVQGTVGGVLNKGQAFLDQYFPPERRAELWAWFNKFMTEKPMLAVRLFSITRRRALTLTDVVHGTQSFILSHIAISGIPLGLFVLMTITVAVFALVAALLVGLLGALLFIAFCVGLALIVLLPTLFFTTLVATFLFLWGVGAYYLVKWFNKKEIPGIHKPLSSVLEGGGGEKSENEKLGALNPDASKAETSGGKKQANGTARGGSKEKSSGKGGGKEGGGAANGKAGDDEVLSKVTQATGVDAGSVGELKKKLNVGDMGELRKKANVSSVDDLKKNLDVGGVGGVGSATKALPTGALG